MKVKLIGCASTMNEVRFLGIDNVDCEFLDYNFHARPDKLHVKLQEIINQSQDYQLIIITFGRCSNTVVGLVSAKVPLLLPYTHDCIALMLGSNEKRREMLKENPGTYYFSQGWLDYGRTPYDEFLEYEEKYGKEKAQILIKGLYGRYNKAVLIITPGMKDLESYRQKVRDIAEFFSWQVDEINGDMGLLQRVLKGAQGEGLLYIEPNTPVTIELIEGKTKDVCDPKK